MTDMGVVLGGARRGHQRRLKLATRPCTRCSTRPSLDDQSAAGGSTGSRDPCSVGHVPLSARPLTRTSVIGVRHWRLEGRFMKEMFAKRRRSTTRSLPGGRQVKADINAERPRSSTRKDWRASSSTEMFRRRGLRPGPRLLRGNTAGYGLKRDDRSVQIDVVRRPGICWGQDKRKASGKGLGSSTNPNAPCPSAWHGRRLLEGTKSALVAQRRRFFARAEASADRPCPAHTIRRIAGIASLRFTVKL